ncbi:MAG: hypothetical protein JWN93_2953 [Hyphomicrobiales bacterium]|nr:hypothetical protein [Hyphomicrobiales bacterium]
MNVRIAPHARDTAFLVYRMRKWRGQPLTFEFMTARPRVAVAKFLGWQPAIFPSSPEPQRRRPSQRAERRAGEDVILRARLLFSFQRACAMTFPKRCPIARNV